MKPCSEYKKLAYLEVLGEIPADKKNEWESHISGCEECRVYKEQVEALVTLGRDELAKVTLSPFEATMLRERINASMSEEKGTFSFERLALWRKKILLPIAAAACLFVVSVIGFRQWWPKNSRNPVVAQSARVTQKAGIEEKEIIQNLDLLEQMDTLRALVKVVDNKEII